MKGRMHDSQDDNTTHIADDLLTFPCTLQQRMFDEWEDVSQDDNTTHIIDDLFDVLAGKCNLVFISPEQQLTKCYGGICCAVLLSACEGVHVPAVEPEVDSCVPCLKHLLQVWQCSICDFNILFASVRGSNRSSWHIRNFTCTSSSRGSNERKDDGQEKDGEEDGADTKLPTPTSSPSTTPTCSPTIPTCSIDLVSPIPTPTTPDASPSTTTWIGNASRVPVAMQPGNEASTPIATHGHCRHSALFARCTIWQLYY